MGICYPDVTVIYFICLNLKINSLLDALIFFLTSEKEGKKKTCYPISKIKLIIQ